MTKTFAEKYVGEVCLEDFRYRFPYQNEDETTNEILSSRQFGYAEVESVDIDEFISALESLKEKGANRVMVAEHAGHRAYYIYGSHLKEV